MKKTQSISFSCYYFWYLTPAQLHHQQELSWPSKPTHQLLFSLCTSYHAFVLPFGTHYHKVIICIHEKFTSCQLRFYNRETGNVPAREAAHLSGENTRIWKPWVLPLTLYAVLGTECTSFHISELEWLLFYFLLKIFHDLIIQSAEHSKKGNPTNNDNIFVRPWVLLCFFFNWLKTTYRYWLRTFQIIRMIICKRNTGIDLKQR